MLHIEFTTDLGAKVTVDVENASALLDTQRQYGRLGWTSGDIPSGGYQFPLENEPDFDWHLIGARKWTSPDGEELVIHKGHAYRRRELEAVDSRKMKLPAAVKYSRGAKSTDPEHIREKRFSRIHRIGPAARDGSFFAMVGSSIGGWAGWVVGQHVGIMTAYFASVVGSAAGVYYGRRFYSGLLE